MNKQKSTKQRMAEYIYNSSEDICKVCANNVQCNEKFEKNGGGYTPDKNDCINGIINYFERLKYNESNNNN